MLNIEQGIMNEEDLTEAEYYTLQYSTFKIGYSILIGSASKKTTYF